MTTQNDTPKAPALAATDRAVAALRTECDLALASPNVTPAQVVSIRTRADAAIAAASLWARIAKRPAASLRKVRAVAKRASAIRVTALEAFPRVQAAANLRNLGPVSVA